MFGRLFPTVLAALALALTTTAVQAQGSGSTPPSKVRLPSIIPTSTPSPKLTQLPAVIPFNKPSLPYVAPPTQLQTTGDTNVCADHGGLGGALACSAAFQSYWIVLIWNWQAPDSYSDPNRPDVQYTVVKDIDGFHAYQVVQGANGSQQDQLVSTARLGASGTLTAFAPPTASAAPNCYVVRAFKGQQESADSQPFCFGSAQQPTPITVSLTPSAIRTISHWHLNQFAECGNPAANGQLVVGFVHCNDGFDQSQEVWRILAKFDVSSLGTVFSAKLRFNRDTTIIQGTDPYDNNNVSTLPADEPLHGREDANCATELLLPTYDWVTNGWDDSNAREAPPVTDLPTVDYANIPIFATYNEFDVTDLVLNWRMAPAGNNGFALRTWDEATQEEDNNWCVSSYRDFTLEVTEMPPANVQQLIDPGTVIVPGAP